MNANQDIYNYRTLRVYLYYRVILSGLLFLMYEAQLTNNALGSSFPEVFRWTSFFYLILSTGSLSLLLDREAYRSTIKISLLLLTDLAALVLLIHASNGIESGLGYLLVITAAIASMFMRGQLALGFAALITLLLIAETLYSTDRNNFVGSFFGTGILGFLVFITAITFQYLTEKIKASSQEAAEKGEYAKQLVQLAEHIVTRMRTGIAVIDADNKIELINDSALQLLDLSRDESYFGVDISGLGNLKRLIEKWRGNPISGMTNVHALEAGREVRISFASLETEGSAKTILYLEDYRSLMQHAQQLKLASLGRLTASIAHEVRNPLGAISHAAQLLSESDSIGTSDARFTEIIVQHSKRVDQIIQNITSLSRRKEPKAEIINLIEWIPLFIEEYSTAKSCQIHYSWDEAQPAIKMDPSHLRQILSNLFDNGLRYSMESTSISCIQVKSGLSKNDETTFIEVVDNGPGVPDNSIQEIFEPFFTTGEQGTGLGLYISRELCEINQASLNYLRTENNKSCFKINFPHHQRMI